MNDEGETLNILLACIVVAVNPIIWNPIARLEYRTHLVSRLFGGPRTGVAVLGSFMIFMNFTRTTTFLYMAGNSQKLDYLDQIWVKVGGYTLVVVGAVLVLTSFWRLGFYNTFLGDYFGILLDARITGFPFNIVNDPMYWGTSIIYVGDAMVSATPVALLLSLCIGLSYFFAAVVEGPFTAKIYAEKAAKSL